MSMIDLKTDLRSVTEQLKRIADALERAVPVPVYRDTPTEAEFSEPTETEQYEADLREEKSERSR